ncbi:Sds3-like-domain-containing protein [Staphylotrichum tortipilum]|uniref:Sds3-like-domain-containing protein n=1 Tax=Staphylotrichum tortipilum TaxID=2831512 RepID=A0AAN6RV10_9PEZI|nr:Sds3-like-domain-containing protein [Staphylotrichum longicolle]
MATGDTEPPLAPSSPPPPPLDTSPSNLSSPLSEPEDKDTYGDDVDLDLRDQSDAHDASNRNGADGDPESDAASESDDESKLSDLDVNDSEAETERLYDTPPKNGATRDIVNTAGDAGNRRFTDRRDRVFERSPSKLHQQLRANVDAEDANSGRNSPSEPEDGEDDELSMPSSEPELDSVKEHRLRPPTTLAKKSHALPPPETPTSHPRRNSGDSRKRKRPSVAENSESEQPPKKRTGSISAAEAESTDDVPMIDDDAISTNHPQSGSHTAEEDNEEPIATTETKGEQPREATEDQGAIPSRPRKGRRSPTKQRKSKSPEESGPKDEAPDEPPEDADAQSLEVPTPQPEDDHADEVDEEAEAAHRNEEELERKKAAYDELVAIEKQFYSFRERLYQERLDQLNQEEAMLTSDNPSHPEYLAMVQCLEDRRAEKIRRSSLELQFKLSVLRHRAVAERAQIMSQFYQAVRESRDTTVTELGEEWYQIQQERRRAANTIPDYGIRFPPTRAQAVKNAVSYNKEVSVLSGFAKHVGFPAAPPISGASEEQLEADLEAIHTLREPAARQTPAQLPAFRPEYPSGLSSFVQGLGAAGEQFIEQTPWANPNHPSHHLHRQQPHRDPGAQPTHAGPSSVPRRQSNQAGGGLFTASASTVLNGDSPVQAQKTHPPAVPEKIQGPKMVSEPLRREPAIQA